MFDKWSGEFTTSQEWERKNAMESNDKTFCQAYQLSLDARVSALEEKLATHFEKAAKATKESEALKEKEIDTQESTA